MKYCQGPKCHEYKTKDRIRGPKGDRHYETRKRSSFYYGKSNFCSLGCQNDWFNLNGDRAIDHFGRTHEPKRQDASRSWYKTYDWNARRNGDRYTHYFVNDLLGQRRPITEQQYDDLDLTTPTTPTT
jgi:hypothetical protein